MEPLGSSYVTGEMSLGRACTSARSCMLCWAPSNARNFEASRAFETVGVLDAKRRGGERCSECFSWNRMPTMPEGEPWDLFWHVESPASTGLSIVLFFTVTVVDHG
jgi:hypothetical protein